ncbi:flagellar motor protein MotS [Oceanobacillus chungangensis]|uniref:Flagellar motor protein MotS n=1 Tax=Oceanobacillus chungangensis TaxID=1229152 RepID=A0A3D8PZA7_9BACI|nr:flagellar motor protein MotS [Oceanobacillus chungangensis]RDW21530.1 flagellar motor protein MotS [Oceanobacillus chungangensis]
MKRRQIRKSTNNGSPKWMVTYSDMITLILVFFILLFSMSQVDQTKLDAVSESFQNRMIFDFLPSIVPSEYPTDQTSVEENGEKLNEHEDPINLDLEQDIEEPEVEEDSLTALVGNVEAYLNQHDLNGLITANRTERGVELVLQDSIFFNPGEANILEEGTPFLQRIGTLLSQIPNKVKVEGHTDSRPMNSFRYPSNWELSGARASSVVRYFIQSYDIEESRFSIAGYGELRPVTANDTPDNMAKNRRVEIIILDEKTE